MALQNGIRQFNVESDSELEKISSIASSMDKIAPIAIRINPDVDAQTHEKIATGKAENKFGIPLSRAREVYSKASQMPGISIVGIDLHIGSQLTDLEPFKKAYQKLNFKILGIDDDRLYDPKQLLDRFDNLKQKNKDMALYVKSLE